MTQMLRRDFIKFLALLAAGAAALPAQIEAFERYYDRNSPPMLDGDAIAVDEITLCGIATKSTVVRCVFFSAMNLSINAFGGVIRWLAAPDQKIVTRARDFTWEITSSADTPRMTDYLDAHISYIDQTGLRQRYRITDVRGSLA